MYKSESKIILCRLAIDSAFSTNTKANRDQPVKSDEKSENLINSENDVFLRRVTPFESFVFFFSAESEN